MIESWFLGDAGLSGLGRAVRVRARAAADPWPCFKQAIDTTGPECAGAKGRVSGAPLTGGPRAPISGGLGFLGLPLVRTPVLVHSAWIESTVDSLTSPLWPVDSLTSPLWPVDSLASPLWPVDSTGVHSDSTDQKHIPVANFAELVSTRCTWAKHRLEGSDGPEAKQRLSSTSHISDRHLGAFGARPLLRLGLAAGDPKTAAVIAGELWLWGSLQGHLRHARRRQTAYSVVLLRVCLAHSTLCYQEFSLEFTRFFPQQL